MQVNLLDVLCEKLGCGYVSDLTQEKYREAVKKAANEFMSEDIYDDQWITAAEYVSLGTVKAKTVKEAMNYFSTL